MMELTFRMPQQRHGLSVFTQCGTTVGPAFGNNQGMELSPKLPCTLSDKGPKCHHNIPEFVGILLCISMC